MSDARVKAILHALEMGCTRRAAAGVGDVHHATFYRWMEADATLRDNVEKAEQKAEATFTAAVVNAIPKSWQAAAWWLERRHHEDFAQRNKVEMSVDLRREAQTIAAQFGKDADALIAEAEAILAGHR